MPFDATFLLIGILVIGALFFMTGPTQDNPHGPDNTPANAVKTR